MDREFGKVERSSINEITLYRSIISPKRIPSLPLFRGPFLPYPSFEHVALPLSLKFQQEGRNVTWLFPSSDKRYLLLSIFPKFSSCRRDKSSKKNRFQHLSCFFFFFFSSENFFFFLLKTWGKDLNRKWSFSRAFQFSILNFRFFLEGAIRIFCKPLLFPNSSEAKVLRDDVYSRWSGNWTIGATLPRWITSKGNNLLCRKNPWRTNRANASSLSGALR